MTRTAQLSSQSWLIMTKIFVTSNNGRIHRAERETKKKMHPGFVRKVCDGQWVSEKKEQYNVEVTCPACKKGEAMSYPDEWNHVSGIIPDDWNSEIANLAIKKDEAIKARNYPNAAQIRDEMDGLRKKCEHMAADAQFKTHFDNTQHSVAASVARPPSDSQSAFKKLLIVDYAIEPLTRLMMEADVVISEGKLVKDRTGDFTSLAPFASPNTRDCVRAALDKLSGDLSYDNVAAAKQLLKRIVE